MWAESVNNIRNKFWTSITDIILAENEGKIEKWEEGEKVRDITYTHSEIIELPEI